MYKRYDLLIIFSMKEFFIFELNLVTDIMFRSLDPALAKPHTLYGGEMNLQERVELKKR